MDKTQETRNRIFDYYKSKTPIFIITKTDQWISGYINSKPEELKFEVLDFRKLIPVRILYSDVHVFKPFEGNYTKLPLPKYLREEM